MAEQEESKQAADQAAQQAGQQIDERTMRVLGAIAFELSSFNIDKRTGELRFTVRFEQGELPEDGFEKTVAEKVV